MSDNTFSIDGEQTCLNGTAILLRGLRLSNALLSDKTADEVISRLPEYRGYGLNAFSVFIMGNRFGDLRGYREDASLEPAIARRLARVLDAADHQAMVVLVGCLYWGDSRAKWPDWDQADANRAVANTARMLSERGDRHVFLDVDNEGMGFEFAGFDSIALIDAAREANPGLLIASNTRHQAVPNADLPIHHSPPIAGKPYIQTEGSPPHNADCPHERYWGPYSNPYPADWRQYDHIGEYPTAMRQRQIDDTFAHLDRGQGYFFASTWLQAAPPLGPRFDPGGVGTKSDPGIRWWLEAIRERYISR